LTSARATATAYHYQQRSLRFLPTHRTAYNELNTDSRSRTGTSPDVARTTTERSRGRDKSPPMTAVHTRAPLEVLSMSAAQRPQAWRKTARQFLDEDDEPPAKRSKVESVPTSNGATKATASRSVASRPKKAKKCMYHWH